MDIKIYSKLELVYLWNLQNLMSRHHPDGHHYTSPLPLSRKDQQGRYCFEISCRFPSILNPRKNVKNWVNYFLGHNKV